MNGDRQKKIFASKPKNKIREKESTGDVISGENALWRPKLKISYCYDWSFEETEYRRKTSRESDEETMVALSNDQFSVPITAVALGPKPDILYDEF